MSNLKIKAQATLEFMIMFSILVVLLFALLGLWKRWADRIIERQQAYSRSRITAENQGIDQHITKNIGLGPKIEVWPPKTPGSN